MENTGECSQYLRRTCLLLNEEHLHSSKKSTQVSPRFSACPGTCDHHLPKFWLCSSLNCLSFPNFSFYFTFQLFSIFFPWICNISNHYLQFPIQRPKLFVGKQLLHIKNKVVYCQQNYEWKRRHIPQKLKNHTRKIIQYQNLITLRNG